MSARREQPQIAPILFPLVHVRRTGGTGRARFVALHQRVLQRHITQSELKDDGQRRRDEQLSRRDQHLSRPFRWFIIGTALAQYGRQAHLLFGIHGIASSASLKEVVLSKTHQKTWAAPSLTAYGSVKEITEAQNKTKVLGGSDDVAFSPDDGLHTYVPLGS